MSTIDISAGLFKQTIPFTEDGIKLAKGFLDLLGRQIRAEQEASKEEEPKKEEG